jgi:hypothetical protein
MHASACDNALIFQVPAIGIHVFITFFNAAWHILFSRIIPLMPLQCRNFQRQYPRLSCHHRACSAFDHHHTRNFHGLCPQTLCHPRQRELPPAIVAFSYGFSEGLKLKVIVAIIFLFIARVEHDYVDSCGDVNYAASYFFCCAYVAFLISLIDDVLQVRRVLHISDILYIRGRC